MKCLYCGLGELDVCSPMVVGQSRAEHEAAVAACAKTPIADGVFPDKPRGTAVTFLIEGVEASSAQLDFPFLPAVESEAGLKLASTAKAMREALPVVHELCALQLFQARVNRTR